MNGPAPAAPAVPVAAGWRARRILRAASERPRDIAGLTRTLCAWRQGSDPAHERLRARQIARRLETRGWLVQTPAGFATTVSGRAALQVSPLETKS